MSRSHSPDGFVKPFWQAKAASSTPCTYVDDSCRARPNPETRYDRLLFVFPVGSGLRTRWCDRVTWSGCVISVSFGLRLKDRCLRALLVQRIGSRVPTSQRTRPSPNIVVESLHVTRISTAGILLHSVNADAKFTRIGYVLLFVVAVLLWWLCYAHPEMLPFWAPWDFSFVEFVTAWLAICWYVRGLMSIAWEERPSLARRIAFFVGVLLIYGVLETRFEYYAEHQFFYNRIQHVVMHHLGPLLIALAWPGAALWRGLPQPLRRVVAHPLLVRFIYVFQQPILAPIFFSGSFFFWLIPAVHFRAMIDPNLYAAMNWTMVADGILFWCLVLDPRPSPPARASFAIRAALAFAVMFPQIIGGAIITFSRHDIYTFYRLCGRIYPNLGAGFDQAVGGLITWIPPAMMSVLAVLLVLHNLVKVEDQATNEGGHDENLANPIISSAQWTGR